MHDFSVSPHEMIASLWRHRELIYVAAKREILGRYRGSMLGVFWSFVTPLFMLLVYSFVFGVIFKSRWTHNGESLGEFSLVLFAGLLVFNIFSECINQAPGLILRNVNYVKKVVFPIEILPVVTLLGALFHALVGFVAWLVVYRLFVGAPSVSVILFPLVLFPVCLISIGFSWFLAALGVYVRDLSQVIGLLSTALMFMTPVFYPVTALPEKYRQIIYLNPLASVVEQGRDVLYLGQGLALEEFFKTMSFAFLFAWVGFVWFQRTRKGFSDVL